MIFVDTNCFLRFFLADNKSQKEVATKLFLSATKREIQLFTSLPVLFEIYWVMRSFYQKNKKKIAYILEEVCSLAVDIDEKEIFEKALGVYRRTNLGLVDSYNLVFAKENNASEFKTFDKKLAKQFAKI